MKGKKNEIQGNVQGMKTLFYGMSGVGKQTSSTICSIKRDFIGERLMGIGRRVIDNPSTRSSKEKGEGSPPNLLNDLVNGRSAH